MKLSFIVELSCLLAVQQASSFLFNFDPAWETLRMTWGLPLIQPSAFDQLPLTITAAEKAGYVKAGDGTCSGKFKGISYYKPGDLSVVLLYDVNGYVAGVQMNYVKSLIIKDLTKNLYAQSDMLLDNTLGGSETYAITAYLVDSAIICNGGRTKEQFEAAYGGTELSFQTKSGLMKIPLKQEEVEKIPVWGNGRCFPSMGKHFWYDTSRGMDCNKSKPVFLLYNHKKLTGFGFTVFGNMDNSKRYEHPPRLSFGLFFETVPRCLYDWSDQVGGVSTVHVYMNTQLYNMVC